MRQNNRYCPAFFVNNQLQFFIGHPLNQLTQPFALFFIFRNIGLSQSGLLCFYAGPQALYGVFAFLRLAATNQQLTHLNLRGRPAMPIRWVDEWDNPDGSIERGTGAVDLFEGGKVRRT